MSSNCIFCGLDPSDVILETSHWVGFRDKFPVTDLHTLLVPKKHRLDYFEVSEDEHHDLGRALLEARANILVVDKSVTGFNIGINCGESAGQTIFHCHVHLIPRRRGDTEDPKGGIRGVIPSKQKYGGS